VRQARASGEVDAVVVSYHGGCEYVDTPLEGTRAKLRAAVQAGADVVLGHHPHVLQRIEFVDGRPIFYSLGNLLMRMTSGQPWTEWGLLARVELRRGSAPLASVCPFRIWGLDPVPLGRDEQRKRYEPYFRFRFERLLRVAGVLEPESEAVLGPLGPDGCATIRPRVRPAEPR
jgi:poly-gamma-glutamate synthesis protein (capsule biosynthesis protein)